MIRKTYCKLYLLIISVITFKPTNFGWQGYAEEHCMGIKLGQFLRIFTAHLIIPITHSRRNINSFRIFLVMVYYHLTRNFYGLNPIFSSSSTASSEKGDEINSTPQVCSSLKSLPIFKTKCRSFKIFYSRFIGKIIRIRAFSSDSASQCVFEISNICSASLAASIAFIAFPNDPS